MSRSSLIIMLACALAIGAGIFGCGSDDDAVGVFSVNMAMFSNTTYVDYQKDSGDFYAEASALEGNLLLMGHNPSAFNGTSATAINAAVSGKSFLLIPTQKIGNLIDGLDTSARAAIESYVDGGGTLVVYGDNNNYDAALVNGIFGFSIANTALISGDFFNCFYNATEAAGTVFANKDIKFPFATSSVTGWRSSSLPAGSNAIYDYYSMDLIGGSGLVTDVAQIAYGSGRIIYLNINSLHLINIALGGREDSWEDSYMATLDNDLQVDVYAPDGTTLVYSGTGGAWFPIGQGVFAYIKVTDNIASAREYTIKAGTDCNFSGTSVCYVEDTAPASDPDKYEPNNSAATATYLGNDWSLNNYMSSGEADWFRYQYIW